jgi:hypothetical protein
MRREVKAAAAIEPITVRVPVALQMLGLGKTKFYELLGRGDITTIKVGRTTLVVVSSIRDFVQSQMH